MMRNNPLTTTALALLSAVTINFMTPPTLAAEKECAVYEQSIQGESLAVLVALPDPLLEDWRTATRCMIQMLNNLHHQLNANRLDDKARVRLLIISSAFRKILIKFDLDKDEASRKTQLSAFIRLFRDLDDLQTVSALSFGATDELQDIRLSSMLVLGNVVDNTTVCVPLTHLADPGLLLRPEGVKGRANLLGVVSVVAPWAHRENYESIVAVLAAVRKDIGPEISALTGTLKNLDNIDARLATQNQVSNKSVSLETEWPGLSTKCAAYVEEYQPPLTAERKLLLKFGP